MSGDQNDIEKNSSLVSPLSKKQLLKDLCSDDVDFKIHNKDLESVITETISAFHDIPFENSLFQTEMFVLASNITPERAYKALGLKLIRRLYDMQEYMLNMELERYDVEDKINKLNDESLPFIERKKIEIELRKMVSQKPYNMKLLNDALVEVDFLYKEFKKYPRYNRQQFEEGEFRHFFERCKRQSLGLEGGRESLINMLHDSRNFESFHEKIKTLSEDQKILLEQITEEQFLTACTSENNVLANSLLIK